MFLARWKKKEKKRLEVIRGSGTDQSLRSKLSLKEKIQRKSLWTDPERAKRRVGTQGTEKGSRDDTVLLG